MRVPARPDRRDRSPSAGPQDRPPDLPPPHGPRAPSAAGPKLHRPPPKGAQGSASDDAPLFCSRLWPRSRCPRPRCWYGRDRQKLADPVPISGEVVPKPTERKLVEIRQAPPKLGPRLARVVRNLANLAETGENKGRARANFGRNRAMFSQVWAKCGPTRAQCGRTDESLKTSPQSESYQRYQRNGNTDILTGPSPRIDTRPEDNRKKIGVWPNCHSAAA